MKRGFIILAGLMRQGPAAVTEADSWRAPMNRCECVELPFEEIARRLDEDGLTLEELQNRTGCGLLCTACLPDLRAHHARPR
jgi:bacterioferritin-associated ferredoxin